MKVALVCDDLTQHGGHEKVILDFCRIFPKAPLFTTMATEKWIEICKEQDIELKTTAMQKLPYKKALNRYYAPFLLHILALESLNLDEYDVVISLSSRFAHGVITKPQTLHVSYMSTVGRMFWESDEYFENDTMSANTFLNSLKRAFLKLPLSYLRLWDRVASSRPDYFISNSRVTQNRIKKYYKRDSTVINPSVDVASFSNAKVGDYFLVLTRLVSWKKIEIAIEACKELNLKLKIIGEGPDRARLKALAGLSGQIELLGYVSDEEKAEHLQSCRALINTQKEDFGIVPLEAMASGRPVVAYKAGGVLETLVPGKTGEYFEEQTAASLVAVLKEFDSQKYQANDCIEQAKLFSSEKLMEKVSKQIMLYTEEYKANTYVL